MLQSVAQGWDWTAREGGLSPDIYFREGGSRDLSEVHCSDCQQCWRVEDEGPGFVGSHLCLGMSSCVGMDLLVPWLLGPSSELMFIKHFITPLCLLLFKRVQLVVPRLNEGCCAHCSGHMLVILGTLS